MEFNHRRAEKVVMETFGDGDQAERTRPTKRKQYRTLPTITKNQFTQWRNAKTGAAKLGKRELRHNNFKSKNAGNEYAGAAGRSTDRRKKT